MKEEGKKEIQQVRNVFGSFINYKIRKSIKNTNVCFKWYFSLNILYSENYLKTKMGKIIYALTVINSPQLSSSGRSGRVFAAVGWNWIVFSYFPPYP